MLFKRWYHSTVGMGNKMFVVGGSFGLIQFPSIHCEVYDSVSQTFDYLETLSAKDIGSAELQQTYCFGNKIVLISNWSENDVKLYVYDVDNDSWTIKDKILVVNC